MSGKLKNFLWVILLGSIGSGFWDIFLKDIVFSIGKFFVALFSSFSTDYVNYLYGGVGAGSNYFALVPTFLIFFLLGILPIICYLKLRNLLSESNLQTYEELENTEENKLKLESELSEIRKHIKTLKILFAVMSVPIFLSYVNMIIKLSSEYNACNIVERRLEIIRPYISDNDFYKLNSDFRLINDLQSLQRLINKTQFVAVENDLKLPEFSLYGVTLPNLKN